MAATDDDTMREIAKALRRHVDRKKLPQVIDDLLDVPGNQNFRVRIETLSHELLKPWEPCDASVKWAEA